MLAKDFMTEMIVTAEEDVLVEDAAKLMAAEAIGSLIITSNDVLSGMVTRQDIVSAQLLSEETYRSLTVADVMHSPVVTVLPDSDVGQVISLMNSTGKHHLPVIDGDDIIGIVAASDIIRVLATFKLVAKATEED
ncbi:CBS domain-containing protein [Candidatus Thorarchaeota archaeon]|nr:MAG: CBS domain-containing protein [Candidatus Thorarchaeota archaeon]